jgi:hypothetical protein
LALLPLMTPDPHGQAALMLVESLLLLLVEQGVLQKEELIEAIDGLVEVKQEIAGSSESVVVSMVSIGLLGAVATSLAAATTPQVRL